MQLHACFNLNVRIGRKVNLNSNKVYNIFYNVIIANFLIIVTFSHLFHICQTIIIVSIINLQKYVVIKFEVDDYVIVLFILRRFYLCPYFLLRVRLYISYNQIIANLRPRRIFQRSRKLGKLIFIEKLERILTVMKLQ